jgi:hypothetical protein
MRFTPIPTLAFVAAAACGQATLAAAPQAHAGHQHPPAAAAPPHAHSHEAHHAAVDARGAKAMGFDQARTVHHFLLYADGGAIDVGVRDAANHADRDGIRAHLPHIAARFAAGDFALPMLVHDTAVPGSDDLARLKAAVRYTFVETPGGGRVDIVTSDAAALAAVHRFLRFQIADHRTGDADTVRARP